MTTSPRFSNLLEHPTSSLWWLISILRSSDTFFYQVSTLCTPDWMFPTWSAGNLQGCRLSDSIPQQPESALQIPLVLGMVVNWLVRHCFSQTTSFLPIHQPSSPFAAFQLKQHRAVGCLCYLATWGHAKSKSDGTVVSYCHKGCGSCPG